MRRNRSVWLGLALLVLVVGCAANRGGGWRIGLDAYRDGRVDDAELIWLEALSQAEEYGDEDPRLAQSLRMLGNLYIHSGRFDEAAPMMERWLGVVLWSASLIPLATSALFGLIASVPWWFGYGI